MSDKKNCDKKRDTEKEWLKIQSFNKTKKVQNAGCTIKMVQKCVHF